MNKITLKRKAGDFGFEAHDEAQNVVRMDTKKELGGVDFGTTPMQLLLMGMAGCSGIDVVSILKKQRQDLQDIEIQIEGEREKAGDVSLWKKANIIFVLKGNLDPEKAQKACDLSMNKYCSVATTLRMAGCLIQHEVQILSAS